MKNCEHVETVYCLLSIDFDAKFSWNSIIKWWLLLDFGLMWCLVLVAMVFLHCTCQSSTMSGSVDIQLFLFETQSSVFAVEAL